jgi:hypothetical protein
MTSYILGFVILVLLLTLLYTTWNQQIGFPIMYQSYNQYQIHSETKKLMDLLKPYYCDYLKQIVGLTKSGITSFKGLTKSNAYVMIDAETNTSDVQFKPMADQLRVILKLIVDGCSDGENVTIAKMNEQLDLLYNAFCSGVQTVHTFDLPKNGQEFMNKVYGRSQPVGVAPTLRAV